MEYQAKRLLSFAITCMLINTEIDGEFFVIIPEDVAASERAVPENSD